MSEHDDFVENCKKRASADRDEMGDEEFVAGVEKIIDTNRQINDLFAGIRVAHFLACHAADIAVGNVEPDSDNDLETLACILSDQLTVLWDLAENLHDSL
jgi:hypothetical protein